MFHVEAFSGTVVEFVHDRLDLFICDCGEDPVLREVLPHQDIGVLFHPLFPGGVGMCEVELGRERLDEGLMMSELLAIVRGQRMDPILQEGPAGQGSPDARALPSCQAPSPAGLASISSTPPRQACLSGPCR